MVSFLFPRELGCNHYWENKIRLGRKEKKTKPCLPTGLKDLGSLHIYSTLPCFCHVHLELLTCCYCCLQPSSVETVCRLAQADHASATRESYGKAFVHLAPRSCIRPGQESPLWHAVTVLLLRVRRVNSFNAPLVQREKCVCWTHTHPAYLIIWAKTEQWPCPCTLDLYNEKNN